MAAADASQGESYAPKESMTVDRLLSEMRTGRFKATSSTEHGRDKNPVEPENGR